MSGQRRLNRASDRVDVLEEDASELALGALFDRVGECGVARKATDGADALQVLLERRMIPDGGGSIVLVASMSAQVSFIHFTFFILNCLSFDFGFFCLILGQSCMTKLLIPPIIIVNVFKITI